MSTVENSRRHQSPAGRADWATLLSAKHRAAENRTLDRAFSAKRSSERDRLTSPAPATTR